MNLNLNVEEFQKIRTLVNSRLSDLRIELSDCADTDMEKELRQVIREYKELLQKMDNMVSNK